jgi:pimeloyl-ACP methyl ester carboxylesterase
MIAYPLEVAGLTTRVLESGTGGRHMVLLHGLGSRADRWRRNLDGLAAAGYRVTAPDLPGHGFAGKGPGFDYSIEGYRAFLAAYLDGIGAERPVLVGASLGGQIAGALACASPERVGTLVLVGSTGLRPFGAETRAAMPKALTDMTRDGIRARLQRGLYDHALVTDELVEEDRRINNSPGAAETFARLGAYVAERIDDDVIGERLGTLGGRVPTLLVWGESDRSIPLAVAEAAHAGLPGSRLVVMAGTAHNPYLDKPDAFNRVVLDFLAGRLGSYESADLTYR